MYDFIEIIGAREHNLKNINLKIPKNKMVVFTGISGSGKSSIVFDTIYAEAQRQLLETFSAYNRKRFPKLNKPDVDEVRYISVPIIINQKKMGSTSRSTVGTITEIYNFLRLLYARIGEPFVGYSNVFSFNLPDGVCPVCKGLGKEVYIDEDLLLDWNKSLIQGAIKHPHYTNMKGIFMKQIIGSNLFDINKPLKNFTKAEINKLLYSEKFELKNHVASNFLTVKYEGVITGIKRRNLNREDSKMAELPFFCTRPCSTCKGARLNEKVLSCRVFGKNIAETSDMELTDLHHFLDKIHIEFVEPLIDNMKTRIQQMIDIGVGYLSLSRSAETLSGGESQRVKIAKQLNCNLMNMIYILDEPSIGLHPRDVINIIKILKALRDKGNSVLIVDHDPSIIEAADYVIDIGPDAGSGGGHICFTGTVNDLKKSDTITGHFLNVNKQPVQRQARDVANKLNVQNAKLHNLRNINVEIAVHAMNCITGVAGSGKSSLLSTISKKYPGAIIIDQSPVGKTSRGNPLTYTGVFDEIRDVFAQATGKDQSYFSFNSKGACAKCKGLGELTIDMHFLDPVIIVCPECEGKRYSKKVLDLKYNKKNISDVLSMTIKDSIEFFKISSICEKLDILNQVGLGYLSLGQSLSSLSGGETQRLKIAKELNKKGNLYLLDEPSVGQHMADVQRLVKILQSLVETKNTVIIIEHNLDIIKYADWVIDLGPEGGKDGGKLVFQGTPQDLIKCKNSYTGKYLSELLS